MPMKDPDVWALIWAWLQLNFGNGSIQSAGAAFLCPLLRMGFMRKNQHFGMYLLMNDLRIYCWVAVPVYSYIRTRRFFQLFRHNDWIYWDRKIREFLFKFINRRIDKMTMIIPETTFTKVFPKAIKGVYQAISKYIDLAGCLINSNKRCFLLNADTKQQGLQH